MKNIYRNRKALVPILVLIAILLAQLACLSSDKKEATEVPPADTQKQIAEKEAEEKGSDVIEGTSIQTEAVEKEPVSTSKPVEIKPTATKKPTKVPPTPTIKPEDLVIIAQGFGQDEQEVGYGFILENPNQNLAFENSKYQIAAYDSNDTVVETESSYIELILPGQKLGIGGSIYLDEGVTVAKIVVQINAGDAEVVEETPIFTTDHIVYREGDWYSRVIGIINNPFDIAVADLRVSAVAYNTAGEIIGGGFTFLNFVSPLGKTGVELSVTSAGDVASVELYPVLSSLSSLRLDEEKPEGAQDLILVKQGFGQDENDVGYGMLIQNPNANFSIEGTMYNVTFYAEDGNVISVENGYIDMLLPQETIGVGGRTYLDSETAIVNADFQILAYNYESSDLLPSFTAENISYLDDEYYPKVTGEIVNPYSKDIENLKVSCIAYNEAGDIIGGGYTYLDFVPANGKSAVEVTVTSEGTPASVEIYAALSSLSDIED